MNLKETNQHSSNGSHSLPLDGINLLLAEDIKMNQLVAKKLIEKLGAKVEVADNGQQAIEKLKERVNYFHAVLMDLHMPVLDGFAATQAIKSDQQLRQIPVIGLTGDNEKDSYDLCMEVGMNGFIIKPFAPTDLVLTIQNSILKTS